VSVRSGLSVFATFGILLCSTGCAGITAINIPGLGYFDFDPPPVTSEDKTLMYYAVAEAANQGYVGARSTWVNHDTGNSGEYILTRISRGPRPTPRSCYSCSSGLPAAEMTEVVHAGGREYRTTGLGVYLERNGKWYRYQ